MAAISSIKGFLTKYPLAKGMLFYSVTWPVGNIIQQTMDGKRFGKFTHFSFHKNFIGMTQSFTRT